MANPEHVPPQVGAEIFCSVLSREAGEAIIGTAQHVDVWLLLEYEGTWGAKATSENELPPDVQRWLEMQAAMVGRGRVQFIRHEKRERASDTLTFYVAQADETEPRLFQFRLKDYRELLEIDIVAMLDSDGSYEAQRSYEPIYLVCTNGRRDRCCALFGMEVYFGLRAIAGDAVWQTTHVGGHRFAANVLTFPEGLYYGRVKTADLELFYEARQQGEIALSFLRGRSCYEEVVQAAEYFLRQESGEARLHAFALTDLQSPDSDVYEVTFRAREGGEAAVVRVRRYMQDAPALASCGKPGAEPCYAYTLLSVKK